MASPPTMTFVSMTQRTDGTYLVDFAFEAGYPDAPEPARPYGIAVYGLNSYGPGKFLDLVSAEYSIDGGDTWNPATAQVYDRRHSFGQVGKIGQVWDEEQPFRFVWDAFRDLYGEPEGEFEALFRLTVEGSLSTMITTPSPTTITTAVPATENDNINEALRRRREAVGFRDFLGQGPIAPFRRGSSDFMTAHGRELVKSAVWVILNTRAATDRWGGEIPWEPSFGALFWTLRHQPADEITQGLAVGYAEKALEWEPRVRLAGATVDVFDQRGGRGMRVGTRYTLITENDPSNEVFLPEEEFVEVEAS